MVAIGAATGGALCWLLLQLAPPRDAPLVQLAKLDAMLAGQTSDPYPTAAKPTPPGVAAFWASSRWRTRVGVWVSGWFTRRGVECTSLRQDLALTGQSFEAVIGRKVVLFVFGFLGALTVLTVVTRSGVVVLPAGLPLLLAVGFGLVLFVAPDVDARAAAAKRRKDFRRALGAYLDLVALEMAGSAAPAEALPRAAEVGSGWPLALLRDTLYRATRSGTNPWDALTELGARIGVTELRDLGQLVKLVAHDGARVRQTLTARAVTMRRRELADAQGAAGERDQSMRLAQMLLALGFVVFLGYPAIVAILAI